ncbi:cation diffusion facilitator family transporter [Rarobacter faecitabidus]|uniref:Cobalt-zinc-cadmium efflux system protein n=1 Tax=Rarobacter faecitabidus TaxID=13243 RepID=A0A542ZP31_RARFA|nr:cation diffusion facilitator family transporter [Rarobacter faecitabidus]TQL62131.1 cobalt-zinc-cadmium efflux system protein [Rarobacter faecitabidus]
MGMGHSHGIDGHGSGGRGSGGHGDGYDAVDHRRPLIIAFSITTTILIAQAIGSILTGSLALLTDTAHMLTDALGLAVALTAANLSLRPPTAARTWGYRRVEVLAALGQAAVLLAVGVYVAVEGVTRLFSPPEVPAGELLIFGIIGLVGNIVSLLVIAAHRTASLNMRAAFLEVANDALGSVGVIVAAIVIWATGWQRADSIAGLFIAALIVPRALILLRDAANVLLESTPAHLDLDEVRRHIQSLDHVREVHDLHASTVATGLPVISAHVVVDDECFRTGHAPEILQHLKECVQEHFEVPIEHSTFQLENQALASSEKHNHA